MDRFSKLNPVVILLFFASAVVTTLLLFNPYHLCISAAAAFLYSLVIQGKKAFKIGVTLLLPLNVLVALFNMLFVHKGHTILFTAFSMRFTLEALLYGFSQGLMLSAVIIWISCYSIVMSADRLLSVTSRIAPDLSLVFSMTLSFLPRLRRNAAEIADARHNVDKDKSRIIRAGKSFSALTSITLEESIEVSQSMKARGFNKGRRAYSKYRFSARDAVCIIVIITLFGVCAYYKAIGSALFIFEPEIVQPGLCIPLYVCNAALLLLPVIIDLSEDIRWLYLKQRA